MKSVLQIIIIGIIFSSCDNVVEKQIGDRIDSLKLKKNSASADDKELVVIYESNVVKVFADTSFDKGKISYSSVKFEPYINFEDFKTKEIYNGKKAKINYTSNSLAREYKSLLSSEYSKEKLNFGGHYCLISWDCGAPCMMSALIDLIDGKVYDGLTTPLGFNFHKDSRMLIANPPDSNGFYDDCEYCHPEIWIWNEQSKKFNELQPKNRTIK